MEEFIKDVKEALQTGIQELSAQGDPDAQFRKSKLAEWLKASPTNSLRYKALEFKSLLAAVCGENAGLIQLGLPPGRAHAHKTDYSAIAAVMMSTAREGSHIGAPFFKKGTSQMLMKTCISVLINSGVSVDRISYLLAKALEAYGIKVVPWKLSGSSGHYAVWNSWAEVNGPGTMGSGPAGPLLQDAPSMANASVEAALVSTVAAMQVDDPYHQWTVNTVLLCHLDIIILRLNLPDLQNLVDSDANNHSTETYRWVWRSYNPENAAHRMALISGILLAKLAPDIGHDKEQIKNKMKGKMTFHGAREVAKELAWTKLKGAGKDVNRIACGFIALGIGLLEEQSPLRVYMKQNGGLGDAWNNKHSQ